jgi:hypothetical protein
VGALLYLTVFTGPALSFAVNILSRLSAKKTMASCLLAIHVLLYLKGTTDKKITFSGSLFDLHEISDADWAGDRTTRRSMTGYVIFICGGPIAWMSKLQCTVATSGMESEYIRERSKGSARGLPGFLVSSSLTLPHGLEIWYY